MKLFKPSLLFMTAVISATIMTSAFADPDKDESGHGRRHKHGGREYKEEYWDGNCKVERKWEKSGEYKEERKCKGARRGHDHHGQAPVYVVPAPAPVVVQPGVTIHGTVRVNP